MSVHTKAANKPHSLRLLILTSTPICSDAYFSFCTLHFTWLKSSVAQQLTGNVDHLQTVSLISRTLDPEASLPPVASPSSPRITDHSSEMTPTSSSESPVSTDFSADGCLTHSLFWQMEYSSLAHLKEGTIN